MIDRERILEKSCMVMYVFLVVKRSIARIQNCSRNATRCIHFICIMKKKGRECAG